jgi:hypothetical protein
VGAGVTLTLRNITIIGASGNSFPLVNAVDGGRIIYETGVSTFNKEALPLSNSKTKKGSGIDSIQAAVSGTGSLTVTLDPGTEVVSLDDTADIGTGLVLNNTNSPAEVTINGSGRTIRLDGNTRGSVITVGNGVTLTLKNITFAGTATNNTPLIRVNTGGKLVLEDGAVITGNGNTTTASANAGGGVLVDGGTLVMTGGTISGNTLSNLTFGGGGVRLANSGTFIMSGGTISDNKATNGGGVYLMSGTFIKKPADGSSSSGVIYGNDADPSSLQNTAANGNGHAVYYAGSSKKRDSTADEGDSMDSTKTGADGGWEN